MTKTIIAILKSKGFSICPFCSGEGEVSYFCGHYTTTECRNCKGQGVEKQIFTQEYMNINTLKQITVKSLRQNGYKVQVGHYRYHIGNLVLINDATKESVNFWGVGYDPKSGKTTAKITKDGIDGFGEALCHPNDNYNRKTGVSIAIRKAFQDWHRNKKANSVQGRFKSGWTPLGQVMSENLDITNEIPAGFNNEQ